MGGGGGGEEGYVPCLACAMDNLFEECYSGAKEPFTPHHLLTAIWQYADNFAGYEQQVGIVVVVVGLVVVVCGNVVVSGGLYLCCC